MTKANTQMAAARAGKITPQMLTVAKDEGILPEVLRDLIAQGKVVIPANPAHMNLHPVGFGQRTGSKSMLTWGVHRRRRALLTRLPRLRPP